MNKGEFFTSKKIILVFALISCILWGSAYPAIKIGYDVFHIAQNNISSKIIFAGYRFLLAGLIVLVLAIILKKKIFRLDKKQIISLILLGISQTALQYTFFYIGLSYTTGVRGAILNGTGTFFSIIIAHFLYKNDKITLNKTIGCVIGFVGVILVNLTGNFFEQGFNFKGDGLIILSTFISSAAAIYGKTLSQKQDTFIITGYQLFIGGIVLTVLGFSLGGNLGGFNLISTSLLIYMAMLSAVAFLLWTLLLKYNKVGKIAVFNFLIPVFGSILSAVFLNESIFNIKTFIALILVCIGIFLVNKEVNLVNNNKEVEA
ncbi:MAG: DMT family transporter [Clostridium perfringens]|nr:DMT family transporter [Clostridium perfringens]